MRKNIFIFGIILMMALLVACSEDSKDEEVAGGDAEEGTEEAVESGEAEYLIRLPHIVSTDNPAHHASVSFKEEVERESDGRVEVQIFPNGELYDSDRELIEALQLNNVEMSLVGTPSLGNFDERFYVLDLPFIFEDSQGPREALSGELGEKLSEGLEDINLKALAYGYDGFRHVLNSKHPIETIEDMKGLKIRVQESEIQEALFNALDSNASPLAYGELYSALQQKVYDGMDGPFAMIDSGKFGEVQEYMSLTGHQYSGLIFLMSAEKFNEFPEDIQDVITVASSNTEAEYYDLVDEAEATIREELEESIEINEISEEELQKFRDAVQPVYETFSNVVGEDLIDMAQGSNK